MSIFIKSKELLYQKFFRNEENEGNESQDTVNKNYDLQKK